MWKAIEQSMQGRSASPMGHQVLRESAVLLPLLERDGEICVLFEERAHQMRSQPGEICFPGGRIEPTDRDAASAAIRETCEELGIAPTQIEPLGPLNFLVTHSQIIYPLVGRLTAPEQMQPNAAEVHSLFTIPLAKFLQMQPEVYHVDLQVRPREDFPFSLIPNGRDYKWRSGTIPQYFYKYEERVIWGLTARILTHFIQLIQTDQ